MQHSPDMILNLPPQVMRTCKQLVRYLYEHDLQPGDQLPSQAELRTALGRNNYTLGAAMHLLTSRGVISRKTRAGTIVLDLDAIGAIPWSIGVATIEAPLEGELSVFANLTFRVLTCLNHHGCRSVAYSHPLIREMDRLAHFGMLQRDLQDELLDGLVMLTMLDLEEWQQLSQRSIPIVHLPFWELAPSGVLLDYGSVVRQVIHDQAANGHQRFAVVSVDLPGHQPRHIAAMHQALAEVGLPPDHGERIDGRYSLAGGHRVARQLLARPTSQRPQVLIVLDDYVALAIANVLAESSDYRPIIAVQTHQQLPLHYPLPVIRYEIDLEALAVTAVRTLQERLLRPQLPGTQTFIPPVRRCPTASPQAAVYHH